MARVLIGWDLGGGHGHAVNMVALGRALAAQGHEVILGVRDPALVWQVTRDAGFTVLATPASRPVAMGLTGGKPFSARSFLDVLAVHGYADADVLMPLAQAWRALVDLVRPDLVLAEFAPLLALVTQGREPCLTFGIGFCVPALAGDEFPVLDARAVSLLPADRVRDALAACRHQLGLPVATNALASLTGDDQLAIGFAEIDPYRDVRRIAACGPLWPLPAAAVPLPATPACLVYLPVEHPGMGAIVAALQRSPMRGHVFIRGAGEALLAQWRRTALTVSTTPLDMAAVLPQVSCVLHHAGTGTVERALAWGRPQIALPVTLEHQILVGDLARLGVGEVVRDNQQAANLPQLLAAVATHADMQQKAAATAALLRTRYPGNALARLVERCGACLG